MRDVSGNVVGFSKFNRICDGCGCQGEAPSFGRGWHGWPAGWVGYEDNEHGEFTACSPACVRKVQDTHNLPWFSVE